MSAPTSIVVGVAVRVIVNVLCAQNVKVAASVLGLWDGLVFYQAQLDDRFLEPETLLSLAFGLIFDFVFFGSIIRTVTYALWVFLGVLAADFGPDLWYELGGEEIGKDIRREASTLLSALPSWGDESESGSERPVRVSKSPRQASTTASTVRERRVPPPQPSRSSRQDYQSTRGGSRVTFGETATSITQTQSEEDTLDDDDEDETAPTETAGLYMTPSTLGSIHTHAGLPSSTQSLLRRMYDDGHETTTLARSPTHPSESGGTTPRGKNHDLPTFTYEKPPFTPSSFEPSIQMPVPSPIPSPIARVPDVLNSYNNFGHEPDPVSMPEPSISNDEDDSKSDTYGR